jgi:PEP-CTERM motif
MNRCIRALAVPLVALSAWLLICSQPASAVVIYDEAVSGDLPNDRLLATLITLPPITDGSPFKILTVIGAVGDPIDPLDAWLIDVPAGHRIKEIELGADIPPTSAPLRFRLFEFVDRSTHSGYDIGPDIRLPGKLNLNSLTPVEGVPFSSSDFGAGLYGMEFKSFDDPPYEVDITLELVPEPGTLTLVGLSGLALLRRRN